MRILYASERPPYPFFLGGAVRCAHQLLHDIAQGLGQECLAVGGADYGVTPWAFPAPEEYGTLGIREKSPHPWPLSRLRARGIPHWIAATRCR